MPDFVHLHNHSDYSLLDGASSIEALVSGAKALGMKHIALTDHGNLFGLVPFFKECAKNEINPILGCEFYVAPESRHIKTGSEDRNKYHHLILLAKNMTGYRNLIKLASYSYTEGFYYKPRIDYELIRKYAEGLICSTACIAGEIPHHLLTGNYEAAKARAGFFAEIYGKDSVFLELQDHQIPEQKIINRELVRLSGELGLPLIATNDIHYVNKDDAYAHDVLLCVGTNKKVAEQNRLKFPNAEFYMKSAEEMERLFGELPRSLSNTLAVAEQCSTVLKKSPPLLPEYVIPPGFNSKEEYLTHLTYEGLKERYGSLKADIKQRADYELSVITSMDFTGYFLIVWDFIHYARERGIPVGPGRGSGAGSIIAYALKITDIDPLKYNLLFERFLNPERVSMPDFDIDFCNEGRQEVIDYVTAKYGASHVGQIITFGTLSPRAVIKDVARALDISFAEGNEITKLIPEMEKSIDAAFEKEPKLKEIEGRSGVFKELFTVGRKLEGLHRHASTHAAGIVIGKDELTTYVPLYRDPKTGAISTQYNMKILEEVGLVKMDFLGLKTLTLIKHCKELILRKDPEFSMDNLPENDAITFELLGEGKSNCVFQFESAGMQGILKRAKPTKIEDLIALNALYRPGPMQFIDQYVDCKNGRKSITYPLPQLEPILKETYGVIVYQEQVMEIARIVGGFSLGKADVLRRIMGKKKPEDLPPLKTEFVEGALSQGISKQKAEEIFDLLVPFSGYGFNKSHAAAYSILAYQTAYLKANYPAEFMAANLTNEIGQPDKLAKYMAEARSMGLTILPPDINVSEKYFTVLKGDIVYGLYGIKNVGTAAVDEIVSIRESQGSFLSLKNFLESVELKTINKKVLESMVQAGLFDSLEKDHTRASLFQNLERLSESIGRRKENVKYGQTSLFGQEEDARMDTFMFEETADWPVLQKLSIEKELLGFYFSGHPLDAHKELWQKSVLVDLDNPSKAVPGKSYTLVGIVHSIQHKTTKTGKQMAFAALEDYNGTIDLVFFPETWDLNSFFIQENAIIGIIGKFNADRERMSFIVEEVKRPEDLKVKEKAEIHIRISVSLEDEDDLYRLRSLLVDHHGDCPVYIHIANSHPDTETIIKASSQISIAPVDSVLEKLLTIPYVEEVWRS